MANTATRSSLRTQILDLFDDAGSFAVTARVNEYIDQSLSELHYLIADNDAQGKWINSKQTITLVSNQEEYDLPTNYYKTHKLFYSSNNRRFPLEEWDWSGSTGYETNPTTAGTIVHYYAPHYDSLADDDTVVGKYLPPGWERFCVLDVVALLTAREESDPSFWEVRKDKQAQFIDQRVNPRDLGNPGSVEDVYNRWGGGLYYYGNEERYLRYRLVGNKLSFIETAYRGV